ARCRASRSPRLRASPVPTGSIRFNRSFWRKRRCNAASARRASLSPRRRFWTVRRNPPRTRCGTGSPATSAAARATIKSSARCWTLPDNGVLGDALKKHQSAKCFSEGYANEEILMSTTTKYKVIGTRPLRHAGVDKVTGRALYGADLQMAGLLPGRILRSPHAHARIRKIDARKALAVPGVEAVVTSADMPEPGSRVAELGEGAVNL